MIIIVIELKIHHHRDCLVLLPLIVEAGEPTEILDLSRFTQIMVTMLQLEIIPSESFIFNLLIKLSL